MTEPSRIDRGAIARMLELVGNDPDMFSEMVNEFFEDAPRFITELRVASAEGSVERIRITAHSFKSNSASFGALALAEQCRALEAQAKAGSCEDAADRIAAIEAEYASAREALQAIRMSV
jgi:two-component system, sensor histidine kinase